MPNQNLEALKELLYGGRFASKGKPQQKEQNQLNPMQESILKAVQGVHKKQVAEAMEQGASGEQVLKDAGVSFGPNQPQAEKTEAGGMATDPLSVALTGQQPPELAQRPIPKRAEWLGGFIKETAGAYKTRLESEQIIRQLLGMTVPGTPKEQALKSLAEGKTIKGLDKAQTEKLAGVLITERDELTFKQEQEVKSIKSDLKRGKGTQFSLMGEPLPFEMKTLDDALNYLSGRKYSPSLFKEELKRFKEGTVDLGKLLKKQPLKEKVKGVRAQYKIGNKIKKGGKTYTVVGFAPDGEPMVE